MITTVYLWQAGTVEGVTDTPQKARSAAASCERGGRLVDAGKALAELRTALARTRVNGVHAGRSRAGQENDSVLTSKARAA